MTDKTTEGITAAPEEVEAVLLNLCGYHLAESDPVFRYTVLTREQVLYDALVTAIKRERGRALAELVANGHKLTEIADLTGLGTRQRVQRLIQVAKVEQAVAEVQAASREFDERLAAVEATLDEVVSGLIPAVSNTPAPTPLDAVLHDVRDDVDVRVDQHFGEVTVFDKDPLGDHSLGHDSLGYDPLGYDPLGDEDEPVTDELNMPIEALNEPTRVMPTLLRTVREEEVPWWRRGNRDTGAA
jgi:hypothetical protein